MIFPSIYKAMKASITRKMQGRYDLNGVALFKAFTILRTTNRKADNLALFFKMTVGSQIIRL